LFDVKSRHDALVAGCGWVDGHLAAFFVERSAEQLLPSIKAIAELAHAAELLLRHPDEGLQRRGQLWLEHAWAALDSGQLIARLIKAEPKLLLAATTLVPFRLAGKAMDGVRSLLEQQAVLAPLAAPQWTLLSTVLPTLGVALPEDVASAALRGSVLAQRPAPAQLSLEAVYMLIHECLGRSAWTGNKLWATVEEQGYLDALLPRLTAFFLEAHDIDVLAELALATHTLPFACCSPQVWPCLLSAQEPSGRFCPPARRVTPLQRTDEEFSSGYHTSLVTIMALAACSHGTPTAGT
jgi:hypothetical protein